MASLRVQGSLQIDLPAKAYGIETTPPYVRHDRMSNIAQSLGALKNNVRCIEQASVLLLEPQGWVVDNTLDQYYVPAGANANWTTSPDSDGQKQFLYLPDNTPDTLFDIVTNEAANYCGAFYAAIVWDEPGVGATLDGQHHYLELTVGRTAPIPSRQSGVGGFTGDGYDYSAGVPVRLVFQRGRPPALQYATVVNGAWNFSSDFGQNSAVASDAGLKTEDLLKRTNRSLLVEWLPLPDQNLLVVSVQGLDEPLILRFSQTTPNSPTYGYNIGVASGSIQIGGMNGTVGFAIWPMRFAPTGSLTSGQIQLPFVYPGGGFLRYYGGSIPDGCTLDGAVASDEGGINVYYAVALDASSTVDGSGLAASTPVLQQVGLYVPPTSNFLSAGDYQDLSPYISEVEEESWFDPEKLVIRRQAGIRLSDASGYFGGATEGVHYAAQYSRRLQYAGDDGFMKPYSDFVPFVLGWTGFQTSVWRADPQRYFDLIIEDGLYPLERKQIGNIGCLDGWCALRAIGFLAEHAGRTDDWIDPLLLVCDTGPDPEGCPHFKLPLGTGDNPAMGFNPEETYLDAMCEICQFIYGIIFADEYNILRVIPYYPGVYQTPFLGTFTDTGEGDGDPTQPEFLSQMWNTLRMNISTKDRRTRVLFGGLDPATNEVQATSIDADDYFGIPGLWEIIHGFSDPYVVISKLFVDPVFTAAYAYNAMAKLFRPTLTVENGAAFLPGMTPLARYNVQESGFVIGGTLALSCERVSSRWSAVDPSTMGTTVQGRSIYNM
ncbi:MAG: hypothetical protein KGL39_27790 [Patescibacteria group bacterium]|nr:hypothetical protein [Patescibacteria group bacterium]